MEENRRGKGLCLYSGGLDSMLAVCVLKEQGVHVEAVIFSSPFFANANDAKKSAEALGVKVHVIDFTHDIIELIKKPAHGFGSCMNPCIDCHAKMLSRAGELMTELGYDFVATGEVLGQRPMSQQRHGLQEVLKTSGLGERLLRPLCAKHLAETLPEKEGLVDREKLLDLEGRNRKPQIALAKKYGIKQYPSPAGGCKLTEPQYTKRLAAIRDNEGLDDVRLIKLLNSGRHFRLENGTLIVVGRNKADNEAIRLSMRGDDVLVRALSVVGPSVLVVNPKNEEDCIMAERICASYADHKGAEEIVVRIFEPAKKPTEKQVKVCNRDDFMKYLI